MIKPEVVNRQVRKIASGDTAAAPVERRRSVIRRSGHPGAEQRG